MSSDTTQCRVWIEVDAAAEPIAGVVHRGTGPDRPFAGWVELVALLESERSRAFDPAGAPDEVH